ncbi:MAG: chemotaxis protein CheD [Desulfovibrionaceae bacterium]|nr:chemotaxis protein CheD [Desulfovibrionaceae bacterium]MBF0513203.1 chemotaxis protein CheD [Desulfovibrionaceae bacterium]
MKVTVLGVGEMGVDDTPGAVIKTFALGSCVAVMVYDLKHKVAGMVHVALPDSSIKPDRAATLPGYFADTGVKTLFRLFSGFRGGMTGTRGLTVRLAGGANIMATHAGFNIGKRNTEAVLAHLGAFGLTPMSMQVGGSIGRTVSIEVDTGRIVLSSPGRTDSVI